MDQAQAKKYFNLYATEGKIPTNQLRKARAGDA